MHFYCHIKQSEGINYQNITEIINDANRLNTAIVTIPSEHLEAGVVYEFILTLFLLASITNV